MSDLYADCPFCGAANSGTHYHTDDSGKWGALACPSCDARGPEIRTNYATWQAWIDAAAAEWNRRDRRDAESQTETESEKHYRQAMAQALRDE